MSTIAEIDLHLWLALLMIGVAPPVFVFLLFRTAPYGRHERRGFGMGIPGRVGWVVMESPAVLLFAAIYFLGDHRFQTAPLALLFLWQLHYVQRTFVYPFRIRAGRTMPLLIVLSALLFNVWNAYINARFISQLGSYSEGWLADPRFVAGTALFLVGWGINLRADSILIALRRPGERGYSIPRGWFYDRICCPNYLGEMLEWFGFALAAWSLAGLAFALFTVANLAPRALANRRWYLETFPDFPRERKALIPYVI